MITSDRIDHSARGRLAFGRHIDAFNASGSVAFTSCREPDVKSRLPACMLDGPVRVGALCRAAYGAVPEHRTVHRMIADADGICIEITATFTAHAASPDFVVAPLRAGERVSGRMFAVHRLHDGRISDDQTSRIDPVGTARTRRSVVRPA